MSRSLFLLLAALLLVAGIVASRSGRDRSPRDTSAPERETRRDRSKTTRSGTKTARSETKIPRVPEASVAPAEAASRFRTWLAADLHDPPGFEEIDALARHLETGDLVALVVEVGLADMEGLVPWVRCALFAEWGRRDPQDAIAHLRDPLTGDNTDGWAARQAWFSLFRGWSNEDPEAAFAILQEKPFARNAGAEPVEGSIDLMLIDFYWQERAYEAVFRELARRDPDAAWARLAADPGLQSAAIRGVFRGIRSPDERLALIERWGAAWNARARSGDPASANRTESLGIAAAVALAEDDPQVALDWLARLDGGRLSLPERSSEMFETWAADHPAQALARVRTATDQLEVISLARGIVRTDPAAASEALRRIEDPAIRADVFRSQAKIIVLFRDYFPEPGRRSNLHNVPQRHETLANLLASSLLPAETQSVLRRELDLNLLGVTSE